MKRLIKHIFLVLPKHIVCLVFIMQVSIVMAAEDFPGSHNDVHHPNIDEPHSYNSAAMYSCDIIGYSNQCREYEILDGAKTTLAEIQNGCESMKGKFSKFSCPEEKALALCTDIIRNYHQPDVIYSNHYYQSKASIWTIALVKEVCGDLGGEFLIP